LKQDFEVLHYCINSVIPRGPESSFSLMTTMVDIVNNTGNDMVSNLVQMLWNDNVNIGNGCLSGYAYKNAETKEYHQESGGVGYEKGEVSKAKINIENILERV
jgi:phosphosulfolactate synthase (CoM biosynthesis protein A)